MVNVAISLTSGLLLSAQLHNAQQLSQWCLHFVASNYVAFENNEDFGLLKEDNKSYVEANRLVVTVIT